MDTTVTMFTLDNCQKHVNVPVEHIAVGADQYFDNRIVEQHMRVIFTDYREHVAELDNHAPSIIADKDAASGLIPKSLRSLLKKRTES
jgi:hypothetical protein